MAIPEEPAQATGPRGATARTRQVKEFDSPEVTEKKQLLYRRRLEALEQRLERLRDRAMASPQHSPSPAPLAQQGAEDGPTELLPSGARTGT